MKKQLILAIMLTLFAISCNKTHREAPQEVKEYFKGKVDGVFFSDSLMAHISIQPSARRGLTETSIEGTYGNGKIHLQLPAVFTTGERILQSNSNEMDAIIIIATNGSFYAGRNLYQDPGFRLQGSGTINILEITSGYIKGTFECIAPADSTIGIFPPITLTEGEFNLKRQ